MGWRAEYRADFERLNRDWIERYFVVEESDRAVFADPYTSVVAPGGEILFLVVDGRVLGTCAVVPHGERTYELAKMAVAEEARGRGYGDRLLEAAIALVRERGADALVLVSNTQLAPAIRLYAKHGFVPVPLDPDEPYQRADIKMRLELRPGAGSVEVRRAGLADVELLVPLFDGYRQFYQQPSDPDLARRFLAERLERGESVVLLATAGERAAGFTQLYPLFSSTRCRRILVLNDLYVPPEFRRSGVGRLLMDAARTHALETGIAELELATARDNHAAQALYESLGWRRDDQFLHYGLAL